jgi:hypothetical protein
MGGLDFSLDKNKLNGFKWAKKPNPPNTPRNVSQNHFRCDVLHE